MIQAIRTSGLNLESESNLIQSNQNQPNQVVRYQTQFMYNLLFVLVTPAYLVFCIQFSIDIIDNTIMYHCSFSLMLSCIVDSVNSVSCFVSILPTRTTLVSIPSWRPQHR